MRVERLIIASLIILFVAARLWWLTRFGLYGDEIFSLRLAASGWSDLFTNVIRDAVHPPLFYVLLKVWIAAGGESILWVKLFPVCASIFSLAPFYLLCRELKLEPKIIRLTLGLMAVNMYMVVYAQDLRMYSLLLLASTCSCWLFVKLINAEENRPATDLMLFVANLLLVYTHYYGWLLVAAQAAALAILRRHKLKRFIFSALALGLFFSPWVYLAFRASIAKGGLGANLSWNPRPGIGDFFWFYLNLNGPVSYRWEDYGAFYKVSLGVYALLTLLFFYAITRFLIRLIRHSKEQNRDSMIVLAVMAFLPSVLAFIASYVLQQSIWGMRYLIISSVAYFLILSVSVFDLQPRLVRTITVSSLIVWAALSGWTELANREKFAVEPMVKQMIETETDQHIRIYTDDGIVGTTLKFYLDRLGEKRFEIVYVRRFGDIDDAHFWAAFVKYRFDNKPLAQEILAEGGFQISDGYTAATHGHKFFLFPVQR
ncbi:MAG: glycosyltransferase family 39 protein [Acidobacteriota bacterium]